MENEVILSLYKEGDYRRSDLYGVLSWKFRRKTQFTGNTIRIAIQGKKGEAFSFFKSFKHNNVWITGDIWHENFSTIGKMLFKKLGYDVDITKLATSPIYCNYWLATPDIYKRYCEEILGPAIKLLSTDEELRNLCDKDAKYSNYDSAGEDVCRRIFDRPYYTYYPFVCERLFTTFCAINGIQVTQL